MASSFKGLGATQVRARQVVQAMLLAVELELALKGGNFVMQLCVKAEAYLKTDVANSYMPAVEDMLLRKLEGVNDRDLDFSTSITVEL
jgi:hypothetical protein